MDTCEQWLCRFVRLHLLHHPREMGSAEVNAFPNPLVVEANVSASIEYLARSPLLYLYRVLLLEPETLPRFGKSLQWKVHLKFLLCSPSCFAYQLPVEDVVWVGDEGELAGGYTCWVKTRKVSAEPVALCRCCFLFLFLVFAASSPSPRLGGALTQLHETLSFSGFADCLPGQRLFPQWRPGQATCDC
ncbi:MAG: phage integrase N-terminal SAM-like domain-containing protein [Cyanobium sp.]